MIWGKERQMEVGPGFFLPSAISTQRLFFCRFSKSKLKEMLTTGSMCIWGNFLAVIRWGQLLGDPSLHWEVEKCFYMYDPTPYIWHLITEIIYAENRVSLLKGKKFLMDLSIISVNGGNNGKLCCHTNSGLGTNFPIFEGPWSFLMARKRVCELCHY